MSSAMDRVFDQMMRGMGAGSTKEDLAAVKAEVAEDKRKRIELDEIKAMVARSCAIPRPAQKPVYRSFEERMQSGELGRLD